MNESRSTKRPQTSYNTKFSAKKGYVPNQRRLTDMFQKQDSADMGNIHTSEMSASASETVTTEVDETAATTENSSAEQSGNVSNSELNNDENHSDVASEESESESEDEDEDEDKDKDKAEAPAEDSFLYNYFESLQTRLSHKKHPSEYERGTFWIQPMQPFFDMNKHHKSVNYLYQPRVFLWLPHLLVNNGFRDLKCPTCKSNLELIGYDKKPHARRVVDLCQ